MISANNIRHKHPSPTVLAGLIAAIMTHHRAHPTYKARIIVTDGASVKLGLVMELLREMVPDTELDRWADAVSLHYLENDYLVCVPLDANPVPNPLGDIPLDGRTPQYLADLHATFNKALDPHLPRAIDPEHSKFQIIIHSQVGTQWCLSLDMQGNLSLGNQRVSVSFRFHTPSVRWTVPNPWLDIIHKVLLGERRVTEFPVRFGEVDWISPNVSCNVYQWHRTGIHQLQYDSNPNLIQPPPISFQPMPIDNAAVQVSLTRV